MKILLTIFLIIPLFTLPVWAETTISLELYPDRMDGVFSNQGLINGQEWFATSVEVEKTFGNLTLKTDIKTFLFGTTGISYYPSSVKFTSSVSYQATNNLRIKFEHYCKHYLKQYPENNYSDRDTLIFEYSF